MINGTVLLLVVIPVLALAGTAGIGLVAARAIKANRLPAVKADSPPANDLRRANAMR